MSPRGLLLWGPLGRQERGACSLRSHPAQTLPCTLTFHSQLRSRFCSFNHKFDLPCIFYQDPPVDKRVCPSWKDGPLSTGGRREDVPTRGLLSVAPSWRMRTLSLGRSLLPSQNHSAGTSSRETSQEKVAPSFSITSTSSRGLTIWTLRPGVTSQALSHTDTRSFPPPPTTEEHRAGQSKGAQHSAGKCREAWTPNLPTLHLQGG